MRLVSTHMENFCSYKNETIPFDKFQDNKILIFGENRDEEGLDSNGSGKSTILDAICWALSGKTSKRGKIAVNDVIGPWGEDALVELNLKGQFDLRIQRTKKDKGSDLKFWVNDKEKHVKGNTEKSQHNLLYYLGVPKEHYKKWFEDFMNTYYFSKEIAQVFTGNTSTRSDKFQFISRFMNLRLLDLARENTKSKLDLVESKYRIRNSNLSVIKSRLEGMASKEGLISENNGLNKTIEEEKNKITVWDQQIELVQQQEGLVNELKNKKEMLQIKESDLKEKLGILKNQYDIKIKEYDELDELSKTSEILTGKIIKINITSLYQDRDKIIDVVIELRAKENNISNKVNSLIEVVKNNRVMLTNVNKCPNCQTPLMILNNRIDKLNPTHVQTEIDKIEKEINNAQKQYEELRKENEIEEQRGKDLAKQIEDYESLKRTLDAQKVRLENKDKLNQEINDIMGQKETFESAANELIGKLKKELTELEEHYKLLPKQTASVVEIKRTMETAGLHIEELNKSKQRNEFIIEKIDEDIEEREKLESKIKEDEDHIDKLRFIFAGFPDIRKARIDEFIPQFRIEANNFMNQLRSKIKIVIDTDRETQKGTMADEFPIEGIDIHGKKRGLETFSDGEKSRISISIAWALRVLTRKKVYLPFQFNMLDEIADGLDETGIDFLNKIMGDDDQYLVITHFSHFKNKFSSSIKAIRENGQSFVEVIQ